MLFPTTRKPDLVCPTPAPASNTGGEIPIADPHKQFLPTRWSSFSRCPTHRPCQCAIAPDCLPPRFDNRPVPSFVQYCHFATTAVGRPCQSQGDFRGIHNEDVRDGRKP